MTAKTRTLLVISCLCLVLYFLSLIILTLHWQPLLATLLILIGLVSWIVLSYWLLTRLLEEA